jgi:hypothetical protein
MSNILFISHSVYLTPDERKMLGSGPSIIETQGISAAVTDKGDHISLREVLCKYTITNIDKPLADVELMTDGFKIYTGDFKKCKTILDTPEGSKWLHLRVNGEIMHEGVLYSTYHQIVFNDVTALERSMNLDALAKCLEGKK